MREKPWRLSLRQLADYRAIAELYRKHGFALQEQEWLEWKYRDNPYGGTRHYKILQDQTIVGAVALLPRAYYHRGQRVMGMQAVDGLMGKEIRGRGLFNEVMEFVWKQEPLDSGIPCFYLGFASLTASVRALTFAGWRHLASFRLWTHVIDPSYLNRSAILGWLPPLLRPLWHLMRIFFLSPAGRRVEVQPVERFTRELTEMFPASCVHGDRSAAFMNWRVTDNPKDRMYSFALCENGKQVGYVVAKETGRVWEIMDLRFVAPHARYLAAFLDYVARKSLAASVDLCAFPGSPYRRLLPWLGFLRRGTRGSLFIHGAEKIGLPTDPASWEINVIDSDW